MIQKYSQKRENKNILEISFFLIQVWIEMIKILIIRILGIQIQYILHLKGVNFLGRYLKNQNRSFVLLVELYSQE